MDKAKSKFLLALIIVLCGTFVHAQKSQPYPANADDIIATVETLSRIDFSVEDAVRRFGEIIESGEDEPDDWAIDLTPFASEQKRIESVTLFTNDDERRILSGVSIDYVKPISISYGKLRQKYGTPRPRPLPAKLCRPGDDCPPAFTGYVFRFETAAGANKKFGVTITLDMEPSKTIPKHADKDFLQVKSISISRIHED